MNKQSMWSALQTSAWLLYTDICLFVRDWRNNLLNATFWPLVLIISNGYIMPAMGMPRWYGTFSTLSMLIIMASFTAWSAANVFAADLEGARAISYELTLPVTYRFVCAKIVLSYAIRAALFNLMSLVVGKLVLGSAFSLVQLSIFKFILVYLAACLVFGAFAFWAACMAGSVERFTNLELRVAGPLFFICGYSFPWGVLNDMSPIFGKLMLATPWLYAYEGIRAAALGQDGSLPYALCVIMLAAFALVFGILGSRAFKRQLDCV